MSLNSPEIDALLAELPLTDSHIQSVLQRDFKNTYFSVYSPPESWWLRICLDHPFVRLHRTRRSPGKKRSHQRFEDFLHSRIKGGRIVSAEHVHRDRIVALTIRRSDVVSIVYIRLWGTRANVIVTDEEGTILDVCFRKPREGLETGKTFVPPRPEGDPAEGRDVRRFDSSRPFNEFIDDEYARLEHQRDRDRLLSRAKTVLERSRRRLASRLVEIENGRSTADEGERNRHYGDLILASMHLISPGDEWVETPDYLNENRPVRIKLNPRLSPADNAKSYYDRAHRAEESAEFLDSSAASLTRRLEDIDRRLEDLPSMDNQQLRDLIREDEQDRKQSVKTGDLPGIEFESRGFRILVGRNARENDRLLRGTVKGNDWWLHARDYAGGYVFIRNQPGKSVPLEVLLDAGNLALFYSKGRNNGKGDLYYTQVKYLRRAKDGPTGLVLPTQEKNLHVELDQDRLRRLGIGGTV
jgi:predicted ribosome quality control (RQC) complex YloA/Tae2 family protein